MEQNSAILIPKIDTTEKDEVVEFKKKTKIKPVYIILPSALVVLLLIILIPSLLFFAKVKKVYSNLEPILATSDYGDVNKIKSDLAIVKSSADELKSSYGLISWMKIFPFVGTYVSDLGHGINASTKVADAGDITLKTIDPLLSELGFKSNETKDSTRSAQERIDFVVNSIPELLPKADEISTKFQEAEAELSKIDPNNYPENFKGVNVREKIRTVLDLFKQLSSYVTESKPLLENAPYLLGMESDRNYLVLFQNDKELRPTGGFLTAYSIMKVSKAKFEPVSSDDIYNLD